MFDLDVFDTVSAANEGEIIHLTHPKTGYPAYADRKETLPVQIGILGPNSDVFGKYVEETVKAERKKKVNQKLNGNKTEEFLLKEQAKQISRKLAKVTTSFTNITLPKTKTPIVYSEAVAYDLYLNFKGIRDQVNAYFEDTENFIKD